MRHIRRILTPVFSVPLASRIKNAVEGQAQLVACNARRGNISHGAIEALQAGPLDVPDLTADEPAALHVVLEFSQRVGRDRLAFGSTMRPWYRAWSPRWRCWAFRSPCSSRR
jgi:hypothetical protein